MGYDIIDTYEYENLYESIGQNDDETFINYSTKGKKASIKTDNVEPRTINEGWIGAESLDPTSHAQDGFWLYVDLISVESFTIVNHPEYPSLKKIRIEKEKFEP